MKLYVVTFIIDCNNRKGTWIDQEVNRLENDLDKIEFHLQRSSLSQIQRKRYSKRRDNLRSFLQKAEVRFQKSSVSLKIVQLNRFYSKIRFQF